MTTIKHPSMWRAFQTAARRWNATKAQHELWANAMWAGTIASQFTAFELDLLREHGFLSPFDEGLLVAVRKSTPEK